MNYSKKHLGWFIAVAVIGIIAVVIWQITHHQQNGFTESYVAQQEDAVVSTILSGRLVPKTSLELRFNDSGTIQQIYTEEGETVTEGDTLAILSQAILAAEENEIRADIAIQNASLNELLAGSRPEDIEEQEAVYDLALLERDHAIADLITTLQDAQNDADNAVRNTVDDFINNPRSVNPDLAFTISNNQSLELEVEFERKQIENTLNTLGDTRLTSGTVTLATYETIAEDVLTLLEEIRDFLSLAALAVNSAESSSDVTDATIRTWKTNLAGERNTINSSIQSIQNDEQTIKEKDVALTRINAALERLQNGSTPESITTQRAQIRQAEARLQTIRARIKNRTIEAPVNGLVADITHEVGETVTAQDAVVILISPNQFEVELEVPELNITSLSLDDPVQINFAALRDTSFTGTITSIKEIATTDTNLVPFYDVRVTLNEDTGLLKSGLIADVTAITDAYSGVITIPNRFVQYDADTGSPYVFLRTGEETIEQAVTLGANVDGGHVVITDGITPGSTILLR